ncbi:hypothetical protein HEK131_39820 [Streptomyces seoulensis]|nr:hypothetical protein HEK131_39820 [Streptomyces seoulensis]
MRDGMRLSLGKICLRCGALTVLCLVRVTKRVGGGRGDTAPAPGTQAARRPRSRWASMISAYLRPLAFIVRAWVA